MDGNNQCSQLSTASNNVSRAQMITRHARQIFSAYRRDEYADPDGFVMQLGAVLERYPDAVIAYVCSPFTGIQRRGKQPPQISDVVEACDDEVVSIERRRRYTAMGAVRPRLCRAPGPPPGQSYEELFAKHGRPHGVFEDGRQTVYNANTPKS